MYTIAERRALTIVLDHLAASDYFAVGHLEGPGQGFDGDAPLAGYTRHQLFCSVLGREEPVRSSDGRADRCGDDYGAGLIEMPLMAQWSPLPRVALSVT